MLIIQRGNPWPDTNIMQMVKHTNEIAPFVVKGQQPLSVLRCLLYRQCTADLMAWKFRIAYCSQWILLSGALFFFLVGHRRCCLRWCMFWAQILERGSILPWNVFT
jgi:hypothetical protein